MLEYTISLVKNCWGSLNKYVLIKNSSKINAYCVNTPVKTLYENKPPNITTIMRMNDRISQKKPDK